MSGTVHFTANSGKAPLLSAEAVYQLRIFIFALAVTHVLLSALTAVLDHKQIKNWRYWESKIIQDLQEVNDDDDDDHLTIEQVEQFRFIQERFKGYGKCGGLYGWMHSFLKQFYGSITLQDYTTMRHEFIQIHCPQNQRFRFDKYILAANRADFMKVLGISWYLWAFMMLFLLLNVNGWHVYFYVSWFSLVILLVVGAKLDHIIVELAHELAEKHVALDGELVSPSDLFWFGRPKILLPFIHFILFQNAFEIAYFFWILSTYGFNSCIMGKKQFLIPRLVISVLTQLVGSYNTLPLYTIVSNLDGGLSHKLLFDDLRNHKALRVWVQKAKRNVRLKASSSNQC
ncbi:MLO-like protein [Rhynchospora pubera]|uniref:MLO-like protein n=1 Tax=Rhynchospora pubera TaxID=906938 RepID=A0AAV8C641_9POAL|nr:MLO-like protein [Rhynchospora pubera]